MPLFTQILGDPRWQETVRMAAPSVALGQFRDPQSLRARLSLVYQEKVPPALVARALPDLARMGFLPPNDLASFIENPAPEIRASALLSLNVKKGLPVDLEQSVLDHIADPSETVRQAAILAVVPLRLQAAVPRLLGLAARPGSSDYATAVEALCALHDPRAVSVYLASLEGDNPRLRKLAESALLAIHDKVHPELVSAAQSGRYSGPCEAFPRPCARELHADLNLASARSVSAKHPPARQRADLDRFREELRRHGWGDDFLDHPSRGPNHRSRWAGRFQPVGDRARALLKIARAISAGLGACRVHAGSERRAASVLGPLMAKRCSGAMALTGQWEDGLTKYPARKVHPATPASDVVRCDLVSGQNRILVAQPSAATPWFYRIQVAPLARRPPKVSGCDDAE